MKLGWHVRNCCAFFLFFLSFHLFRMQVSLYRQSYRPIHARLLLDVYRAACNAAAVWRGDFCLSVCPSVCLSVTRVDCGKTVESSVQMYIPDERTFILIFWEEEWLVGGDPSTWNFGSTDPHWNEIADFQRIIARSASAVTPSE